MGKLAHPKLGTICATFVRLPSQNARQVFAQDRLDKRFSPCQTVSCWSDQVLGILVQTCNGGSGGPLGRTEEEWALSAGAGAPIWWPERPSGGRSIRLVAFLTVSSKSVLYGPPETQFEYNCKDCGLAVFNSERGHEKNTIDTDSHNVISSFWACWK